MSAASGPIWPNLEPKTIYGFITGDFKSLWDSLALNKNPSNGGNFTFAMLDMILLEFISRYCQVDGSGQTLRDFSDSFNSIDNRYFRKIENFGGIVTSLKLPYLNYPNRELIHVLFDLIRNGEAHQYQQIVADLQDTKLIITTGGRVRVIGRTEGMMLYEIGSRTGHLDVNFGVDGSWISITFRPEVFFTDITKAVDESGVLNRALRFDYFNRHNSNYSSTSYHNVYESLVAPDLRKILKK